MINVTDKGNKVRELAGRLRRLNVQVTVIDGNLDIDAPEDVLTDELLADIRSNKQGLIDFISAYYGRKKDVSEITSLPEQPSYALSVPQRRIWILSQFEAINVAYNMPGVYEFRGDLNIDIFKAAFARVNARHDTLRTVFRENEERVVQQFIRSVDEAGFEVEYTDLSQVNDPEATVSRMLDTLTVQAFDLANGPLLRACLFRLEKDRFIFFFNMHHIISDGWSMGVLIRDAVVFYNAMLRGEEAVLPELRIQYKDYAAWQLQQLSGGSIDADRAYWLDQFKGQLPVLDLPIANVRPPLKTNHGAMVSGRLSGLVVSKLKEMGRQEGVTLFMELLAGVNALLYRYTRQEDIIIGSPVAGRENKELDDQIGFYINTLALRTRFSGSADFKTLARQVRDVTLAGFRHQAYPFDELVDTLNLKRDLSRSALFDVMVAIQNNEDEARTFRLGDVEINQCTINHLTSKFDIIFNFTEVKDELHYTIEYNTDLYPIASIVRMREHFDNLMVFVVDNAHVAVDKIDFLTAGEKETLRRYNETTIAYPKGVTLVSLFAQRVAKAPSHTALIYDDRRFSYQQLYEKACQLANYLKRFGDVHNLPIPIVARKRPEQIWGVLGILMAGAHYIPVKGDLPKARINELIAQSGASLVLVHPSLNAAINADTGLNIVSLDENIISGQPLLCDTPSTQDTDLAYIIFTSGSTGKPKGVMIDHRGAVNTIYDINTRFGVTEKDVVFGISDLNFDLSVYDIFGTLAAGATLVLPKEDEVQDPEAWLDYVSKYNVTLWDSVPQLVGLLIDAQRERTDNLLSSLRLYFMSGDWIPVDLPGKIKTFTSNAMVISMGGATEGSIWSIYYPVDNVDAAWKSIPYGYPLGNQEMYILNDALEPCPYMVPGGIFIGGEGVARGYYKDDGKTAYSFIEHPVSKKRLYRTGDIGVFMPEGYINFVGRIDGQVKIRGYRIEIGEIESVLRNHPLVGQCIISTTPLEGRDRQLVAYIVAAEKLNTAELADYIGVRLPQYMVPSYFVQIDHIPLTANGKVDKKRLPDPRQNIVHTGTARVAPRNQTEQLLAEIWSDVLRLEIEQISIEDNFFELGGHSLKATHLRSMIHHAFNVQFKINELFTHVSISDQARLIASASREKYAAIPQIGHRDYYLLSSAQRRLWVLSQFEETNKAYNMPLAFMAKGSLNIKALESALREMVTRHEILRTIFRTQDDGEVYQEIQEPSAMDCSIRCVDMMSASEDELRNTLKQESLRPFDLATGPLLVMSVYKASNDRNVLFVNMHHIIGDGWSFEVFLKEMLQIYSSKLSAASPNLEKLNIQYKDYAHWQRELLESSQMEKHKAWWLQQFSGELPVLQLPAVHSRPSVQTHKGAVVNGSIPAVTTHGFKTILQDGNATLFMGLIAAVNALFFRYTGDEDIIIGSPVAGREHADLSGQIGLYIGMLALRTCFSGTDGFDRLLQQVKEMTLGAVEHQLFPFDELVAQLDPRRDPSRSALFDTVVILHNNTRLSDAISIPGMSLEPYKFEQATSKFDITFNFAEIGDQIDYAIEFNTDIYDDTIITQMATHLQNLIASVVANSNLPLCQLDYMDKSEQQKLLRTFNDTSGVIGKHGLFLERFMQQVEETPDATAVIFRDRSLSFARLQEQSNRLAANLQKHGVSGGDLVGVYLERSENMLMALIAVMKAGAAYIPLDPTYPKDRIAFMLADAGIKTILTQRKLGNKLPEFRGVLINIDSVADEAAELSVVEITESSLMYVIYTSGSTGQPKGVQVTHGNVANFLKGMDAEIEHKHGDTLLAITTISFDISVLELFWTLVNGMTVVMQPARRTANASSEVSVKKMDFSLFYFASEVDYQNKYQLLIEGAKFADRHGFAAVWTPERHFHEFGGVYPNPSITGAAIAAITENVQIRAGSCVLPLHNPIRVAEEWSVVDNLSNGRVGISFASGWVMNDFLAFAPDSYDDRYDLMYKGIEQVRSTWRGEPFTLSNPSGKDATVEIFPKPIQKELPFWITAAGSPETFRAAGAKGANMLTHLLGQTVEELRDKIAIYRQARREAGHLGEGHVTLMVHTFVGEDVAVVKEKVRTPFKTYLRNSVGLLRGLGKSIGQDVDDKNFRPKDMEALLNHAFDRYFDTAALFGTLDSCLAMVNKFSLAGVDEVGCLIDFGLDFETAFGGLNYLHELKELYSVQAEAPNDADSYTSLIRKHKVTHVQCTPSALKLMLQEEDAAHNMASLQQLIVGGEALPHSLVNEVYETADIVLHNMYGPTETTVWSATTVIAPDDDVITIGRPILNTQIYILDKYKNIVPVGVEGEIYIGGAGIAKGYLNRPELTAERFVENPYREGERLYRTGDIGKWRADGSIEFAGRRDEQVKVRGHRIETGEIEVALRQHSAITDAIVTTFTNKDQDTELVAYVTARGELNAAELRQLLGRSLPTYMVPVWFVQLETLPLTPNGKINRKALPPPQEATMTTGVAYTAPRNEDEERLAELWSVLLEKDQDKIGIHDNFFDLGGQSLSAIRLMGIISKELNMRIPLSLIFENPTIYEFVGWLNMHRDTLRTEKAGTEIEIEEVL